MRIEELEDGLRYAAEHQPPVHVDPHQVTRSRTSLRGALRSRQLILAAAIVVLIVAVTAVAFGLHRGRDTTVATRGGTGSAQTPSSRPAGATDQIRFRMLGVRQGAHNKLGALNTATSAQTLAALWADAGYTTQPPTIDFHDQVVVSITIPDDACPPKLDRFVRIGSIVEARFTEPPGACAKPLIPRTFVAALDWSTIGPGLRIRLRGQPQYHFRDIEIFDLRPAAPPAGFNQAHAAIPAGDQIGYVDLTAIRPEPPGKPLSELTYPDGLPGYRVTNKAGKLIGYYRYIDKATGSCSSGSPCDQYLYVGLDGKVPSARVR